MRIALHVLSACLLLSTGACTPTAVVGNAPGGAPIVRVPLRLSNVHVIQASRPVLVDAGTIGDMADLLTALEDRKISARNLGLVVLTHGHADHSGLAFDLRRLSGATLMMGAADVALAQKGENDVLRPTSFTATLLKPFITSIYPSFEPDIAVKAGADGDLRPWGVDGKAIAMPGHTSGSIVVVLSDNSAFVGDMMMGGSFGGAIFPSSPGEHYYHADREQNRRNIKTLLDRGVEKFYLGHGGPVVRADVIAAFSGGWSDVASRQGGMAFVKGAAALSVSQS